MFKANGVDRIQSCNYHCVLSLCLPSNHKLVTYLAVCPGLGDLAAFRGHVRTALI